MKNVHDTRRPAKHAVNRMSVSHLLTPAALRMVEQLRTLVDRSPLPMVATEGAAHVVCYVNPAFGRLIGQGADTILGTTLTCPALPADTPAKHDDEVLDVVFATGKADFALDLARLCPSAQAIHLPCAVWPILAENGLPAGLLIQVSAPTGAAPTLPIITDNAAELRDVNERLLVAGLHAQEQAEQQIILRGEAEAALTMRDEFISIAAHELRTPLTGIKTSAQLALRTLAEPQPDQPRTVRYLLGIVTGANRLVALVNDLMDVSRMRSGNLLLRVTLLDLGPLVRTVAQRYAEINERHQVTIDVPDTALLVPADAGRMEQVLDNLLGNAIKYSPGGGEIHVTMRQQAGGVVLTVSDTGIGLSPGAPERIFQPFGRAANARQQGMPGMGLGLHICNWIAEAHGGRMWAESPGEGQGMTVGLWLPRP